MSINRGQRPAAARASSGLANARARFYGLVARTEGLQPGTFKVAPATGGKVAFAADKVTQRGNTARVQGSGTESGTAAGTAFELRISDVVLTRQGSRWLVDTYSIADTAEPTPTPLDQFFPAIPVEAKSGALAVRFEVAKSYADPSKRTVTDGAWALTVRNVGKRGVATFSQMTARSADARLDATGCVQRWIARPDLHGRRGAGHGHRRASGGPVSGRLLGGGVMSGTLTPPAGTSPRGWCPAGPP